MTPGLFTPRARRELRQAAEWIAADNPTAAENLLATALAAAKLTTQKPLLARAAQASRPPDIGSGPCEDTPTCS